MNPQVAQEAFQVVSNVTTTVARELIVGRKEERLVEKRAEKDKRIAELQSRRSRAGSGEGAAETADAGSGGSGVVESRAKDMAGRISSRVDAGESGEGGDSDSIDVSIEPLVEGEDCSMCVTILEAVASMDPERRAVGIAEYGRMKQAVDTGADAAEVRAFIDQTDVLSDALSELRR